MPTNIGSVVCQKKNGVCTLGDVRTPTDLEHVMEGVRAARASWLSPCSFTLGAYLCVFPLHPGELVSQRLRLCPPAIFVALPLVRCAARSPSGRYRCDIAGPPTSTSWTHSTLGSR